MSAVFNLTRYSAKGLKMAWANLVNGAVINKSNVNIKCIAYVMYVAKAIPVYRKMSIKKPVSPVMNRSIKKSQSEK